MGRSRRRAGSGQAIVIVAICMAVLIGMAALAVDLGNASSVRSRLRTAADAAALAGARELPGAGAGAGNYVAMQYLAAHLDFNLPVGACSSATACPAGTYAVAGYKIALADPVVGGRGALDVDVTVTQPAFFSRIFGFIHVDAGNGARALAPGPTFISAGYALAALDSGFVISGGGTSDPSGLATGPVYARDGYGANNRTHPATITSYVSEGLPGGGAGSICSPQQLNHIDGQWGATYPGDLFYQWAPNPPATPGSLFGNVAPPTNAFANTPPDVPAGAPTFISPAQAKDAQGHWNPGIYSGFVPSGGLYNGGVYKIVGYTGKAAFTPGSNVHPGVSGKSVGADAVAFILDSSDVMDLDLASNEPQLNGIDDLQAPGNDPNPDPAGTHNLVFWTAPGASGWKGAVTYGPSVQNSITGIVYLPNTAFTSNGTAQWAFYGSVYFSTMTLFGGGNLAQIFKWVCGLGAVLPGGGEAVLIR